MWTGSWENGSYHRKRRGPRPPPGTKEARARAPHLLLSQESRAGQSARRLNLCGTSGSTSWQEGRSHACCRLNLRDNVHLTPSWRMLLEQREERASPCR